MKLWFHFLKLHTKHTHYKTTTLHTHKTTLLQGSEMILQIISSLF